MMFIPYIEIILQPFYVIKEWYDFRQTFLVSKLLNQVNPSSTR